MLALYKYTLTFRSLFKTGAGDFYSRSGLLLHYQDSGVQVLSEASPLPGFSSENLDEVSNALTSFRVPLEQFLSADFSLLDLQFFLKTLPGFPSLQFALSYLGIAMISKRHDRALHKVLKWPLLTEIKVNHVVGFGTPEEIRARILEGIKKGFKTFKIKTPWPLEPLLEILPGLSENHPGIKFRLDANRSWSVKQFEESISLFKELPIEYIEEPIRLHTADQLDYLLSKSPVPVALDESIHNPDLFKIAYKTNYNTVLILKPMIMGNFFDLFETISTFRSPVKNIVVTTALESRVGRSMVSTIAALLGDPQMAQGLNTGHLFNKDLFDDFKFTNGTLKMAKKGIWHHAFSDIDNRLIKRIY